jgi:hypothetical protein
MLYETEFLKALVQTILIETVVLFLLVKLVYKSLKIKNRLLVLTGIVASFSTLPYVWFILPLFIQTRVYYILISEISVVLIEWLIIQGFLKISYKKALFISFICNMASFLIGLLIHRVG